MIVINKDIMVALSIDGAFGNTVEQWDTKEKLFASGFTGNVYIRIRGGRVGGVFIKNLPICKVAKKVAQLVKKGHSEKDLYFGEWISPKLAIMNCELCRSERYLELRYSRLKMTQREAFRMTGKLQAKNAHGLTAEYILRSVTDEWSFNVIMELLEKYPDSVIEFTIYKRSHGTIGRDIIFWEVRNY